MKWIKSRNRFLNEAKIKDVILPMQSDRVTRRWSEKYLEYEEIEPTDKIKQGKWKLSEEDKIKVLNTFFGADIESIFNTFENLDKDFVKILSQSIDLSLFDSRGEKFKFLLENFDPNKPTIDQISILYEPIFRKLNVNETISDEYIKKDESGRPIRDEQGNMTKVKKEAGDPIFEKNLVNIKLFTESYNRCYDNKINVDDFYTNDMLNLSSFANENHNAEYKIDFKIFDRDIYLSINHNARDILNISISKFFTSCQHLYDGGYSENILANVFDPNSIPAFLIFDTPIFWKNQLISDFLPLSRLMIRNIESFEEGEESRILFHRAYPDRMKETLDEIIEKYSGNKKNIDVRDIEEYIFTPDIDQDDKIPPPYLDDSISVKTIPYIGVNTKKIYLNRNYDWSKIRISPKANVKEIIIETNVLPDNFIKIPLTPEWIKFKFLKINDLSIFNSLISSAIAFDKCKLEGNVITEWSNVNEVKKLQLVSCEIDSIDLSNFKNLEELQLIYTIDYEQVDDIINSATGLKKLVISGDLMSGNKKYFNDLKSKGLKIEIVGPVI